ncbi:MAG TPA: glycosyltransferase [Anaeromyxobacter sp.]|nr:glycosyltransferase [Anaeromyxobacter sp.]
MPGDGGFRRRVAVFRVLAVLTLITGGAYLAWRWGYSLNTAALWFALPMAAAETYAYLNTVLFVFMMWRPRRRVAPPPLEGVTVDVFITTYNEPVELLRLTVEAALAIDWPQLKVHLLDDGARPEMRALCAEVGCGYITRGEEWEGKPRHAKAGNVNNALMETEGEFILILDADQIPDPRIVRSIIGYFRDPRLAFVQTPQHFYNLPPGDPFGTDAPLFYGPIMQGKDGWDAAFFCGSNAILRREALLQLGLTEYVRDMQRRFEQALRTLRIDVQVRHPRAQYRPAARLLREALASAREALRRGAPLERVSDLVRQGVAAAQDLSSRHDILEIAGLLGDLARAGDAAAGETRAHLLGHLEQIPEEAKRDLASLGVDPAAMDELDLTRPGEAQPVLPMATISVTEDMATAMRLHALGWKSAFHSEVLAYGLAPEDLRTALNQRLRWAQGTIQVLMRENPFLKPGLTLPQRIEYFTTMLSYFDGFASLVFVLAPIFCLATGIAPIRSPWLDFLARLAPYLALNRIMFLVVTRGIDAWRSEQYSLALFPLWIRAVVSTLFGRRPRFVVTPKQRQSGNYLRLVWPQITVIALTLAAIGYGAWALLSRGQGTWASLLTNAFWGLYNVVMLVPIVRAAVFRPPEGWKAEPPQFLMARP